MGDYAGKGRDLVKKADKKLGSFSLFGSGSKYDEAAELLEKACNNFKLGKACEYAGLLRKNFCLCRAVVTATLLCCQGLRRGRRMRSLQIYI